MANDWRQTVDAVIELQGDEEIKTEPGPSLQWYPTQWTGDQMVNLMDWQARGVHHHLLMLAWKGFDLEDDHPPPCSIPDDSPLIGDMMKISDWDSCWRQVARGWKRHAGRLWNIGLCKCYLHQMSVRRGRQKGGQARAAQKQATGIANAKTDPANARNKRANAKSPLSSSSASSSASSSSASTAVDHKEPYIAAEAARSRDEDERGTGRGDRGSEGSGSRNSSGQRTVDASGRDFPPPVLDSDDEDCSERPCERREDSEATSIGRDDVRQELADPLGVEPARSGRRLPPPGGKSKKKSRADRLVYPAELLRIVPGFEALWLDSRKTRELSKKTTAAAEQKQIDELARWAAAHGAQVVIDEIKKANMGGYQGICFKEPGVQSKKPRWNTIAEGSSGADRGYTC